MAKIPEAKKPRIRINQALMLRIMNWPLMSLQQSLISIGARLVKHACYYWLLLAEAPLIWWLF